jgi:tetratricopeptide (TPR) repeat protein
MRDHLVEGRDRIASALAIPDAETHPAALARALGARGGIAYWLGDYVATKESYLRALAIARTLDDRRLLAEALSDVALAQEDISDGKALAETAERGLSQLNEALAIYRDLGDRRGEAGVLWTIGTGYTYIGDFDASERFLTQAADIAEDSGDVFHASWATYMRAGIAGRNGDIEGAVTHVRHALEMFSRVGDVTGIMLCIVEIGYGLSRAGDVADGLRLAAAATAFERRHGGTYIASVRGLSAQPDPQAEIGEDAALAAAWTEGEALSLDEAVVLALAYIDEGRWRVER